VVLVRAPVMQSGGHRHRPRKLRRPPAGEVEGRTR